MNQDLIQKNRQLQEENALLREKSNSNKNSHSNSSQINFENKYKKALKEIYEVIQANKQLNH